MKDSVGVVGVIVAAVGLIGFLAYSEKRRESVVVQSAPPAVVVPAKPDVIVVKPGQPDCRPGPRIDIRVGPPHHYHYYAPRPCYPHRGVEIDVNGRNGHVGVRS